MRTAFPAQELPVRSALTVAANCVNRTRKRAASVTAYSVLPACPSIHRSTPKLHQQTTGNVGNERPPKLCWLQQIQAPKDRDRDVRFHCCRIPSSLGTQACVTSVIYSRSRTICLEIRSSTFSG